MSSLPKQYNPFLSSSPSRQSPLRANIASSNPTTTTSSQPRPIGKQSENKRQDVDYTNVGDGAVDETVPEYTEQETEDAENLSQPARNFKPFFTLIEDANSSDYHHPTVHYIFSDDDAELITEASLRALETSHASSPLPPTTHHHSSEDVLGSGNQESSNLGRPSLLPPPIPGVKERFIVLDVEQSATATGGAAPSSAPDTLASTSAGTGTTVVTTSTNTGTTPFGYRVVSAHSLTPDWQVLDASLSPAPTFDTPQQNTSDQATVGNTLMLRVEGTSGYPRDVPFGKDRETAKEQTLEEMMEQFDKRMSELRRVIETSGDYAPMETTITTAQPPLEGQTGDSHDTNTASSPPPIGGKEETQDAGKVIASTNDPGQES